MKKALMLVSAALFLLAPLAAASVKVESPNGGETWVLGTPQNITWTSKNAGSIKVDIILRRGNTKVGVIKSQVALADGIWPWASVLTLEDGTPIPPGTNYIVRIRDAGDTFRDDSNAAFTISDTSLPPPPPPPPPPGPASITVTSPNGGETWAPGWSQNITWNAANFAGVVDLILKKYDKKTQKDVVVGFIAKKLPATQGAHPWKVGTLLDGKSADIGGGYKVRVVKNYEGLFLYKGQTLLADESDNPFSLASFHPSDEFSKPSTKIEKYSSESMKGNCYFLLSKSFSHWGNPYYREKLWKGLPEGLANVGFLWYKSSEGRPPVDRHYEIWRSVLTFNIQIMKNLGKGEVAEAKIWIRRIWNTQILLDQLREKPGITDPCLAGVVLLDAPAPCEWGGFKGERASVPLPAGKTVPVGNWDGDYCFVDVTEHVRQIVKGERKNHGFMLYSGIERDPTGSWDKYSKYVALNAGGYHAILNVKFVQTIPPNQ